MVIRTLRRGSTRFRRKTACLASSFPVSRKRVIFCNFVMDKREFWEGGARSRIRAGIRHEALPLVILDCARGARVLLQNREWPGLILRQNDVSGPEGPPFPPVFPRPKGLGSLRFIPRFGSIQCRGAMARGRNACKTAAFRAERRATRVCRRKTMRDMGLAFVGHLSYSL